MVGVQRPTRFLDNSFDAQMQVANDFVKGNGTFEGFVTLESPEGDVGLHHRRGRQWPLTALARPSRGDQSDRWHRLVCHAWGRGPVHW